MKDTVIANRKKGDWPIIKKYFEDRGVDTSRKDGSYYKNNSFYQEKIETIYYGVIDGSFHYYSLRQAQQANATILEVSDIDKEFKVGDVVKWEGTKYNIGTIMAEIEDCFVLDCLRSVEYCNKKNISHATPEEIKQYKGISDTVTIPKSFVIEAHKSACSDWKKRIEEVVTELFPKKMELEVGKWYRYEGLEWLGFIGKDFYYGFNRGNWFYEKSFCYGFPEASYIPAPEQEVFEALRNEAVKRGFKVGVRTKCLSTNNNESTLSGNMRLIIDDDLCRILVDSNDTCGWTCIFRNGEWAEIISTPIPKEIQSIIDKYGKEKLMEYVK